LMFIVNVRSRSCRLPSLTTAPLASTSLNDRSMRGG
jgi:hypothetical protein